MEIVIKQLRQLELLLFLKEQAHARKTIHHFVTLFERRKLDIQ